MKNRYSKIMTYGMLLSTMGGIGMSVFSAPVAYADEISDDEKDIVSNDMVLYPGISHDEYLNIIGPVAQEIAEDYGIYASVMIAQSILESGWGQSGLAQAPNNNLFGIKGSYEGESVSMSTQEDGANGYYTIVDGFRKYPSHRESLIDNAKLIAGGISGNPGFYSGAWKENAPTYREATLALTGTYATSRDYNEKLNGLIETYGLTVYDTPFTGERTPVELVDSEGNGVEIEKVDPKPDYKLKDIDKVDPVNYKVKENDSLWGISRENDVSIDQLEKWNEIVDEDGLDKSVGKEIKVNENISKEEVAYQEVKETKPITVKVKPGESFHQIVNDNDLTLEEGLKLNPEINDETLLHVGDEIVIGEEVKEYDKILTPDERKALDEEAKEEADRINRENAIKAQRMNTTTVSYNVDGEETSSNSGAGINTSDLDKDVAAVIAVAEQQIGKPYVWGARGPDSFDCSGLMQYAFMQALGYDIGSWTVPQESAGEHISVGEAQPGDLLFWGAKGGTSHVALYIGNGQYIHAPQPGENVTVQSISAWSPDFAVRMFK